MFINWFVAFFRLLVPFHTKSAQSYKEILTYASFFCKKRLGIRELGIRAQKRSTEVPLLANR